MSSDLGLNDYQFYLGPPVSGGLTFGDNTNVDVDRVKGLTDLDVRRAERAQPRRHGDIPGLHVANSRLIEFDVEIRKGGLSDTDWRDLIDDVEEAFSVSDLVERELHWQWPGEEERFVRCRPTKRDTIRSFESEMGLLALRTQLIAHDPRVYVAAPSTDNANSGSFTVTNNGKQKAYPIITFHRTAQTQVKITNSTTGQVLDIAGLPSASTDVVADMDQYVRGGSGLIIYVGSTNHYGDWVVPREPFYLTPGSNSITLDFGDTVDFQWWSTYI